MNKTLTLEEAGELARPLALLANDIQREVFALRAQVAELQLQLSTADVTVAAMDQTLDRVHAESDELQAENSRLQAGIDLQAENISMLRFDRDRIEAQCLELQEWKDAVPVQAIMEVVAETDFHRMAVDDWLEDVT